MKKIDQVRQIRPQKSQAEVVVKHKPERCTDASLRAFLNYERVSCLTVNVALQLPEKLESKRLS